MFQIYSVNSSAGPVYEKVGDRMWFAAEEFGQQWIGIGEVAFSCGVEAPQQHAGHGLGCAVRDLVCEPLLVVDHDSGDAAAGEFACGRGEVGEGDGITRGERDGAVEGTPRGEDDRGGFGRVGAVGPGDGAVRRRPTRTPQDCGLAKVR